MTDIPNLLLQAFWDFDLNPDLQCNKIFYLSCLVNPGMKVKYWKDLDRYQCLIFIHSLFFDEQYVEIPQAYRKLTYPLFTGSIYLVPRQLGRVTGNPLVEKYSSSRFCYSSIFEQEQRDNFSEHDRIITLMKLDELVKKNHG